MIELIVDLKIVKVDNGFVVETENIDKSANAFTDALKSRYDGKDRLFVFKDIKELLDFVSKYFFMAE